MSICDRKYWTYSPGSNARKSWNFSKDIEDGVMGIGQDRLGDLYRYGMNLRKLARDMCKHYKCEGDGSGNARYMLQFRDEVQVGDVVFVKRGRYRFAGVGIIVGDYWFDRSREKRKQVRSVKWIRSFDRKSPICFTITTLTQVSDSATIAALLSAADIKESELDKYKRLANQSGARPQKVITVQNSVCTGMLTLQQAEERLKRISCTEEVRETLQRAGQRELRNVVRLTRLQCEVTKLSIEALLVASHIKDWKVCTHSERLDPENVLFLAKNYDAAFDRKLISFDANGRLVKSDTITWTDLAKMGIKKSARIGRPSSSRSKYLKWHQDKLVK